LNEGRVGSHAFKANLLLLASQKLPTLPLKNSSCLQTAKLKKAHQWGTLGQKNAACNALQT